MWEYKRPEPFIFKATIFHSGFDNIFQVKCCWWFVSSCNERRDWNQWMTEMKEDEDHQRTEKVKYQCGRSVVKGVPESWYTWRWYTGRRRSGPGELYVPNFSALRKVAEGLQDGGVVIHFKFWKGTLMKA